MPVETTRRKMVEYALHVGFFAEYDAFEVPTWDIAKAQKNMPKHAYGFRFYESVTKTVTEDNETFVKTESINKGPWHYVGQAKTLAEVKLERPQSKILIANMEGNGWDTVCVTIQGNTVPVEENDIVLSPISPPGK
jgi:hypothetical protein